MGAVGRHGLHSRTPPSLGGSGIHPQVSPAAGAREAAGWSPVSPAQIHKFLLQVSAGYTALFIVDEKTT